ncbi:MAG: hypothetical protein K6T57_12285 [Thermaceae bacterium]|nr:hypothetical protein [Thermaceae bacterium]
MGVFETLRDNVVAGVNAVRGRVMPQAVAAPQPSPAPSAAPAAVQTSPWGTAWLDGEDFAGTGIPYRSNEWFALSQFRCPETAHFRIAAGERRIRMYLYGQKTVPGQNLGAPAARTVNLPGLVQSQQAAPALPSAFHPDVAVWAKVGGVWSQCVITAINYATGDVTFTEPAGVAVTDNLELYYLHGDGQFRFRVLRELGGIDDSAATVFNGSLAALHTLEQTNLEVMWSWPQGVELTPGTRLSLEVYTSSTPMLWNSRNPNYLHIYAEARRIEVLDKGTLGVRAELSARNGL